ncbi:MAG TPA: ABC-2 family transporter protein [Stackebrandtia sp.]|jgi:ABC-2 type transport system permease protein|uniref:ABC transporter permease n=1 Tax=Stackebrandtia sp. TaxID=2023065 RepID=UPI002D5083B5|nr:ABC-2 family transporter protein [Stackebrandtia sp.]HZE41819.1 ABC-2 family transporter protein [Stackebrandtia sp.]
MRMMLALMRSGFRRYSTYRQATAAAAATNTIFGMLRCYVLLATAVAATTTVGYDVPQLSTYVWVGQGIIGVVMLWGPAELAEKVRTGQVVSDLLRPVNPIWTYLATDLGRAGFSCLTRLVVPVAFGAIFFPFYWPRHWWTYGLFACSLLAATGICFAIRHLVNLSAFWLLDIRGITTAWLLASGIGSGLIFPIDFLPGPAAAALKFGTPLPSIVQFPADVLVEHGGAPGQLQRVALQFGWVVVCLAAAFAVQHRATRRLVVQGG